MPRINYPPDFCEFWAAYPFKRGKYEALQVWLRLKRQGQLPVKLIMFALEREKQTQKWRENIIEWPKTWLRQRRFEDYDTDFACNYTPDLPFDEEVKPTNEQQRRIDRLAEEMQRDNPKWSKEGCRIIATKQVLRTF